MKQKYFVFLRLLLPSVVFVICTSCSEQVGGMPACEISPIVEKGHKNGFAGKYLRLLRESKWEKVQFHRIYKGRVLTNNEKYALILRVYLEKCTPIQTGNRNYLSPKKNYMKITTEEGLSYSLYFSRGGWSIMDHEYDVEFEHNFPKGSYPLLEDYLNELYYHEKYLHEIPHCDTPENRTKREKRLAESWGKLERDWDLHFHGWREKYCPESIEPETAL